MLKKVPNVGDEVEFRFFSDQPHKHGHVVDLLSSQFIVEDEHGFQWIVLLNGDWSRAKTQQEEK